MRKKNNKKTITSVITGVALSFGYAQFSSPDYLGCRLQFTDEYAEVQQVQATIENYRTDEIIDYEAQSPSFIASFDKEKEIVLLIKKATSDENENAELDKLIREVLSDDDEVINVLDYIEISKNDDLYVLVAKVYLNLVQNRREQVVYRLIDGCLSSNDVSINSFGIDLLSLHISYPSCKKFLNKKFSHQYLVKKMDSLINEVK